MLKTILMILVSGNLLAAGDGIPTDLITVQLVNVVIFVGLLVWFTRPLIKAHFTNRKNLYIETVNQAQKLKEQADAEKAEIETKIANFKKTAEEEIARAKKESEELKQKIIDQGNELAKTIEAEAQKSIANELEKAKESLKKSILEQSLNEARTKFASNLSQDDHNKMNKRFVDSVGAN